MDDDFINTGPDPAFNQAAADDPRWDLFPDAPEYADWNRAQAAAQPSWAPPTQDPEPDKSPLWTAPNFAGDPGFSPSWKPSGHGIDPGFDVGLSPGTDPYQGVSMRPSDPHLIVPWYEEQPPGSISDASVFQLSGPPDSAPRLPVLPMGRSVGLPGVGAHTVAAPPGDPLAGSLLFADMGDGGAPHSVAGAGVDPSAWGDILRRAMTDPGFSPWGDSWNIDTATPTPTAAPKPEVSTSGRLGDLSMKEETHFTPDRWREASAVVSPGVGDLGGVSYGAYQLSSKRGVADDFLQNEGRRWADQFGDFDPTQRHGDFGRVWRQVAAADPDAFFQAQHDYVARTHYQPVLDRVAAATGLDVDARPDAVRNVVWSMAVQHGGAPKLVTGAVAKVNDRMSPDDPGYDRALINQLYDDRTQYVIRNNVDGLPALLNRYKDERARALRMLDGK